MLTTQERTELKSSPLSGQVRAFLDKTQKDISSLISTTSDLSQLTSGQINQLEKEISDHIQSTQNIISRLNQALHIDGALSGMSGGSVINPQTMQSIISSTHPSDPIVRHLAKLQEDHTKIEETAQNDMTVWSDQNRQYVVYLKELELYHKYISSVQHIIDKTPSEANYDYNYISEQSPMLDLTSAFSPQKQAKRHTSSIGEVTTQNNGPIIIQVKDKNDTPRTVKIYLTSDHSQPYQSPIDRSQVTLIDTHTNQVLSTDDYPINFDMSWFQKTPLLTNGLHHSISDYLTIEKKFHITLDQCVLSLDQKKNIIQSALSDRNSLLQKVIERNVIKKTFTNNKERKSSKQDMIKKFLVHLPNNIQSFRLHNEKLCRETLCRHIQDSNPSIDVLIDTIADTIDAKGTQTYTDKVTNYLKQLSKSYTSDTLWQTCIESDDRRGKALGSRYNSLSNMRIDDTTKTLQDAISDHHHNLNHIKKIGSQDYSSLFQKTLYGDDHQRSSIISQANDQTPIKTKIVGSDGKKRSSSLAINYDITKHYTLSRTLTDDQGTLHDCTVSGLKTLADIHTALREKTTDIENSDNIQGAIYVYSIKSMLDYIARCTLNELPKKKFKSNDNNLGALYRKDNQAMVVGLFQPDTTPRQFEYKEGLPSLDHMTAISKAIQYTQANKDRQLSETIFDKKANIGQGSLVNNALLSAWSRLDKQQSITIRPDLILYPTQYGWTWLHSTGEDKRILKSDGTRASFISDQHAASELRQEQIRLQQAHDTEDIRHDGMRLLDAADHALRKDNIEFAVSGGQVAQSIGKFAGGTLGLLSFNKSGFFRFARSAQGMVSSIGKFIGANIKQFTGLVSLGGSGLSTLFNTGKYLTNSTKNALNLGQETIGKKYINPLFKESNSIDFLLHHMPKDTQNTITDTNSLINQICAQQIRDKLMTQNDHVASHRSGASTLSGLNKSFFKRIRQRNKSKTSESTKRLDTYQRLRGGYFLRYGPNNQKVLCVSRDPFNGELIIADLKVRNLTSTFDNHIGYETIGHDGSYKHQEQLIHEYDSGPFSGDLFNNWTHSYMNIEESPIRSRCKIPETISQPWSDPRLQDICQDPMIWTRLMEVVDKGYGNRIAALGNTTPEHPLPAYDKPLNYNYNSLPALSTIPKHTYPHYKIPKPTYNKPSSEKVSRDKHTVRDPEKIDISLVIDESGSMNTITGNINRYEAQRNGLINIMNDIYTNGIGSTTPDKIYTEIYSGGDTANRIQNTKNSFSPSDEINLINQIGSQATGNSDQGIKESLRNIYNEFLNTNSDYQKKVKEGDIIKAIYVTTDAQSMNLSQEINNLKSLGIYVYGIGIQTSANEIESVFSKNDPMGNGVMENNINKLGQKMKDVLEDSLIESRTDHYEEANSGGGKRKRQITTNKLDGTETINEQVFDNSGNEVAKRTRTTRKSKIPTSIQIGPLSPKPIYAEEEYLDTNTNQRHHIIKKYNPQQPGSLKEESYTIGTNRGSKDILDHKRSGEIGDVSYNDKYNHNKPDGTYEHYDIDASNKRHITKSGTISTLFETKIGNQELYEHTDTSTNTHTSTKHIKDITGNIIQDELYKKINNMIKEYSKQTFDTMGNLITKERIVYKDNSSEIQYEEKIDTNGNVSLIEPVIDTNGNIVGTRIAKGNHQPPKPIALSKYSIIDSGTNKEIFYGELKENTNLANINKSVISSFTIQDYHANSKLFPPIDQLMSAVGGDDATTKATIQNLLTSGDIHALKIDKKGKIRTIGLDDSSTTIIPLSHLPFIDKVWIDENKMPLTLITRQGDVEIIEHSDLDANGYLDISKMDEEVLDKLHYTQGILQVI